MQGGPFQGPSGCDRALPAWTRASWGTGDLNAMRTRPAGMRVGPMRHCTRHRCDTAQDMDATLHGLCACGSATCEAKRTSKMSTAVTPFLCIEHARQRLHIGLRAAQLRQHVLRSPSPRRGALREGTASIRTCRVRVCAHTSGHSCIILACNAAAHLQSLLRGLGLPLLLHELVLEAVSHKTG